MTGFKKAWFTVDKFIFQIVRFVIFVCTVLMVVVSTMQVLMRYVLSMPIKWSNEFCCFMLVYDVFLGAALGLRQAGHVRLEIEKLPLPHWMMSLFHFLSTIAVYVFLIIYLIYGYQFAIKNGNTLTEVMKWPYITLYCILPISAVLMLWGQTSVLIENTERKGEGKK